MTRQIIVVGTGRSGTSMVAGVLHALGVHMGDKLIGPTTDNPLGHWEDREFSGENRRTLKDAGGDWANPPSEDAIDRVARQRRGHRQYLVRDRHVVSPNRPAWGFKDPRTSLLLPHWMSLDFMGDAHIVWAMRNIEGVIASLGVRNGFPREKAHDLVLTYQYRITKALTTAGRPVLEVQYENAIADPERTVAGLAEFVGVKPTQSAVAMIRPELCHHV